MFRWTFHCHERIASVASLMTWSMNRSRWLDDSICFLEIWYNVLETTPMSISLSLWARIIDWFWCWPCCYGHQKSTSENLIASPNGQGQCSNFGPSGQKVRCLGRQKMVKLMCTNWRHNSNPTPEGAAGGRWPARRVTLQSCKPARPNKNPSSRSAGSQPNAKPYWHRQLSH